MASHSGDEVVTHKKLKLTMQNAAKASAQEWKQAWWGMISETTRNDRGVQETVFRSIMAYIEKLTSFLANFYATSAPGTQYVPPTLIEVQSWKSDCKCAEANFNGGEACTCSHDPASYTAEEDLKEAMEDRFGRARLTGKADAIAQRKRNMQTTAVTRVNGDLVNAILAVTNKVPQLAHCKVS